MKFQYYKFLLLAFLLLHNFITYAQENLSYQTPPKDIADLINAPLTPLVSINTEGSWMVLLERPDFPSIEELAQPELRLAGLRINPRNNGASRAATYTGIQIKSMDATKTFSLKGLPANPKIGNVNWSPDGQKIAFILNHQNGIELWTADIKTGQAQKMTDAVLNGAMGLPFIWLSDSKTLIYKSLIPNRGAAPLAPLAPEGPIIQENIGKKAAVRTYQDLLKNKFDEDLFVYYASSQLMSVTLDKQNKSLGISGIIGNISTSPDGKYVLVTSLQRPFSYLVPANLFPTLVEIWDLSGNKIKQIANLPLAEDIPKGFDAVRSGPRNFQWRADKPASLYWVEALDKGNPQLKIAHRDQLIFMEAPFNSEKQGSILSESRITGIIWGNDDLAIANEYWWATRKVTTSSFSPGNTATNTKKVLFDLSSEDRYADPGDFQTRSNNYGRQILLIENKGKTLFLTGDGASPEGDRPFLDEFDLSTSKSKRLWRSEAPYYEMPVKIIDISKKLILTQRESKKEAPNYFLRDWTKGKLTALTNFQHPYPQLKDIEKQVIQYKRKDGIALQGNLYLPKNFKKGDKPLPVLLWAYPDEFKSAANASQVQGSPHQFIRIGWGSPLYWVTQGYAIFDGASMPVVGEGSKEPNDSFVEQLVANAQAAIDKLVEMGVGDRNKFAVGGHSYGAFMAANLLAHCDLFAAGIARSGAYNRTLTPFGFQAEERTYWEAPQVYNTMSPFMNADKINEPILLIHGEADNNSGTFPIQSERFYNALKGLGKTSRYVVLPHESHGYQAKESVLHMLWEMNQWLDKYVKNGKEAAKGGSE